MLTLVLVTSARGGACPPAVELRGAPAVVSGLESLLSRRGVTPRAVPNCAAARAEVAITAKGYAVSIEDGDGRRSERAVTTLESAGTLIETWVRPELGPLAGIEMAPAPVVSHWAPPRGISAVGVGSAFETSLALDRSLWLGAGASAGVLWGPVWLGARGRLARQSWASLPSGVSASGTDAALLAVVGWPFALGRLQLVPSAGLGLGWWSSTLVRHDAQDGDQQGGSSNSGELRTELALSLSLPLTRWLSAFGAIATEYLPQARTSVEEDAPVETRGYLRLGLGLRVEGP
jgi:hypothetical protein